MTTWSKLFLGDAADLIDKIEDGAINCIITDPPYGTENLCGGYGRKELHQNDGKKTILNDTDLSAISGVFPKLDRVLKNGWAAVFYAARKTPEFIAATAAKNDSPQWFGNIVWDKGAPGLGYTIRYAHEDIAIFRFGDAPKPNGAISSVIHASPNFKKNHPHQKPISVIKKLIYWMTLPGDTVFDPFMGSGCVGIACAQTGRNFIGFELDEKYYHLAKSNIDLYGAQKELL